MKKLIVTLAFTLTDEQEMKYNKRNPGTLQLTANEKDVSITFGEGEDAVTLQHEHNPHSGFGVIDTDYEVLMTIDLASWKDINERAARYSSILSLVRQRKPFYRQKSPK